MAQQHQFHQQVKQQHKQQVQTNTREIDTIADRYTREMAKRGPGNGKGVVHPHDLTLYAHRGLSPWLAKDYLKLRGFSAPFCKIYAAVWHLKMLDNLNEYEG